MHKQSHLHVLYNVTNVRNAFRPSNSNKTIQTIAMNETNEHCMTLLVYFNQQLERDLERGERNTDSTVACELSLFKANALTFLRFETS